MNVHFPSVPGAVKSAFREKSPKEEILTSRRGTEQGQGCGTGQRMQMRKPELSPAIEWTWSQVREGSGVTLGSGCRERPFL